MPGWIHLIKLYTAAASVAAAVITLYPNILHTVTRRTFSAPNVVNKSTVAAGFRRRATSALFDSAVCGWYHARVPFEHENVEPGDVKAGALQRGLAAFVLALSVALVSGCASQPPSSQHDLCEVFRQHPDWYDAARKSEKAWGVPAHVLMAFVHIESGYRSHAKPPLNWILFIPIGRPSSAQGFAQIQDPAWQDYRKERGSWFKSRSDIDDALDFVGWYNNKSHELLGVSIRDPRNLYLAYHEGHAGYRRGSYRGNAKLLRTAERVDRTAQEYGAQLRRCDEEFRCRKWYQFGPFCD